jgi:hypothetical protein
MKSAKHILNGLLKVSCLIAIIALGIITIIGSGPSITQYVWKSNPTAQRIENEFFLAEITPNLESGIFPGYKSFELHVRNKTNKNIEIVWDKTLFIMTGTTNGRFMFEGVVYRDRNNPKPPDIVFANSSFSKKILPCNLVEFSGGRYASWYHNAMPPGENGVYLTIGVEGKELSEKITVYFTAEKTQ